MSSPASLSFVTTPEIPDQKPDIKSRASYETLPQELRDQILTYFIPSRIHIIARFMMIKNLRQRTRRRAEFATRRCKILLKENVEQEKFKTLGRLASVSRTFLHDVSRIGPAVAKMAAIRVDLGTEIDSEPEDSESSMFQEKTVPAWLFHYERKSHITHQINLEIRPASSSRGSLYPEQLDITLEKADSGRWTIQRFQWPDIQKLPALRLKLERTGTRAFLEIHHHKIVKHEIQAQLDRIDAQPQFSARELWLLQDAVAVWPNGHTESDHITGDVILAQSHYPISKCSDV